MSPENYLKGLAQYVEKNARKSLYVYAGYSQTSGALLLKVKATDARVALRPWLRSGPVGMQDLIKSGERYNVFRGQEASVFVHVAREFRDNARRFARRSANCSLIIPPSNGTSIEIIGSQNLPEALLQSIVTQTSERGGRVTYDFEGTVTQGHSDRGLESRVVGRVVNPTVFLSYSWDSEIHRRWVLRLAADLTRNGIKVLIDEWDLPSFNNDLHHFMESGVREADFVIMVCTPSYAHRANNRTGGVGIESSIITGEFYAALTAGKFVPITRNANAGISAALPSYLKSRLAIDFTDDKSYQARLEDLLRRLLNQPKFKRPPLGPVPRLESEDI